MHGDAALFDALAAAAETATAPDEHYRYLYALGDFRDPALDRARAAAVAVAAAAQPGHGALPRALLRQPGRARPRAGRSSSEHWAALEPKVTISGGDTNLIRSMSSVLRRARRATRSRRSSPRTSCRPPRARSSRRSSRSTTASRCARSRRRRSASWLARATLTAPRNAEALSTRCREPDPARYMSRCSARESRHRRMPVIHARHGARSRRGCRCAAPTRSRRPSMPAVLENSRSPSRSSRFSASVIPIAIVRLPGPRQSSCVGERRRRRRVAALSSRARGGGASRRCRRADRARGSAPPPASRALR